MRYVIRYRLKDGGYLPLQGEPMDETEAKASLRMTENDLALGREYVHTDVTGFRLRADMLDSAVIQRAGVF